MYLPIVQSDILLNQLLDLSVRKMHEKKHLNRLSHCLHIQRLYDNLKHVEALNMCETSSDNDESDGEQVVSDEDYPELESVEDKKRRNESDDVFECSNKRSKIMEEGGDEQGFSLFDGPSQSSHTTLCY